MKSIWKWIYDIHGVGNVLDGFFIVVKFHCSLFRFWILLSFLMILIYFYLFMAKKYAFFICNNWSRIKANTGFAKGSWQEICYWDCCKELIRCLKHSDALQKLKTTILKNKLWVEYHIQLIPITTLKSSEKNQMRLTHKMGRDRKLMKHEIEISLKNIWA